MTKNKNIIYNLLKGSFLTEPDSLKNWGFLIFLAFLSLIMIGSAHSIDKKVQEISSLSNKNKEFRSIFVAKKSELMNLKMESSITRTLAIKGIKPSKTPPYKIKVIIK